VTVYRKGPIELRLGDYRDALADVEPDAVITDPPYGERTHAGHDRGGPQILSATGQETRRPLRYLGCGAGELRRFTAAWGARARGWLAVLSSHDQIPDYEAGAEDCGRYAFAPLPVIQKRPRLLGDGPASWAVYLLVSRPRTRSAMRWGCLPGAYFSRCEHASSVVGAKPLDLMRAIVRDYSRPGDLICDPCAGGATTLIAAALEGRRAIGAELDPETYEKACARIERTALTPPLPGLDLEPRPRAEQTGIDFDEVEPVVPVGALDHRGRP